MAVLAAFDLADLCPWKSVQVYTYGAPRPGNKAFKEQYEAKLPDTWHVMNSQVRTWLGVACHGCMISMFSQAWSMLLLQDQHNQSYAMDSRLDVGVACDGCIVGMDVGFQECKACHSRQ